MQVIGHRGAAALGPENTIAAVEAGLAAGADGVEIDVRRTADGVVVLMHDADVSRTTGATGRVEMMNASSLAAPTLVTVLEVVPADRVLVVELKGHPWEAGYDPAEPLANAVAGIVAAAGERRIVVSSFNPMALQVIRERTPGAPTAVLTSAAFDLASNLAAAIAGGHAECHVPAALLDAAFVESAHRAGRRVAAWTVDEADRIRAFAGWGVDAIISDDPRAARAAIKPAG